MATLKQRRAIKILQENPSVSASRAMIQAGYSPKTARKPQDLTNSNAFKIYLDSLDDRRIVYRFFNFATEDKDKRVALEAGEKILRLKDRYPAGKLKIAAYNEELERIRG